MPEKRPWHTTRAGKAAAIAFFALVTATLLVLLVLFVTALPL